MSLTFLHSCQDEEVFQEETASPSVEFEVTIKLHVSLDLKQRPKTV